MASEPKFSKLSTTIEPISEPPAVTSVPDYSWRSLNGQRNVASIGLFIASALSTVLSGLFLAVAIVRPRYGFIISSRGPFSPSSAALLVAFVAKIIELTFVMTFLSFLGQILSRRAFHLSGINIANLAMRSWVLQPGTLLTQWTTIRVAGISALGLLSLVATAVSLLYTTATGVLVQPQLRMAPLEHMTLGANVTDDFNIDHPCESPITFDGPSSESGTCTNLKYTATCGVNLKNYMEAWANRAQRGDSGHDRPTIFATLDGNINVTTAWLHYSNVTEASERFHRIVNNITISIPHRDIPRAVENSTNGVLQPKDLNNAGSYSVTATVPNAFINALCVSANRTELAPIVYETMPEAKLAKNGTNLAATWPFLGFFDGISYAGQRNDTVFDELFGWSSQSDADLNQMTNQDKTRPVFMKYPLPGNTIANDTQRLWGRSVVYLLGKNPPKGFERGGMSEDYFICSLKTGITQDCSTRYNASSSGRTLEALCGADHRYDGAHSTGVDRVLPGWIHLGSQLLNAMSLNMASGDGNSSNARLLSQLQLQGPGLNPKLPSPAEALVSIASCTVLDLVRGIPFVPLEDYYLPEPTTNFRYFNATARITQYMSGTDVPYQQAFIIIIALTFLVNILILVYYAFLLRFRFVIDICEPLLTFVLGYSSPPSQLFEGSLLGGLDSSDYAKMFVVEDRNGEVAVVPKATAGDIELREGDRLRHRLRF